MLSFLLFIAVAAAGKIKNFRHNVCDIKVVYKLSRDWFVKRDNRRGLLLGTRSLRGNQQIDIVSSL